jgi:hypothetical protein
LKFFMVGVARKIEDPDSPSTNDLYDAIDEQAETVRIAIATTSEAGQLVNASGKDSNLAFWTEDYDYYDKVLDFLRERDIDPKHPDVYVSFVCAMADQESSYIADGMSDAELTGYDDPDVIHENFAIWDPFKGHGFNGPCVFVSQQEVQGVEIFVDPETLELTADGTTYKNAFDLENMERPEAYDHFGTLPIEYTPYEED